jgi:hypothetical protein
MAFSGQKTVTTAGTAERLSTGQVVNGPVMVKALPANTDNMYVGNVSGDVSSSNGMVLTPGDVIIFNHIGDLREIWLDSAVDGEGAAWLILDI